MRTFATLNTESSAPWHGPLVVAIAFALIVSAALADAQVISGRVTDPTGAPIPRVRVLARLASDTSGASGHITTTGEHGGYRLPVATRGIFVVSTLRVGYLPSANQTADLTTGDAKIDMEMEVVRLSLGAVEVAERADLSCLPIDSPKQSTRVREWLQHAQDLIRSRRAIEHEYTYSVHEGADYRDKSNVLRYGERDFVQRPSDSSHVGEIPPNAHRVLTPIPLWARLNYWAAPDEGYVLKSHFTASSCFDTTLVRAGRGQHEIRYQPFPRGSSGEAGAIRMTDDGMLTQIRMKFQYMNGRSDDEETLAYTSISLDGQAYPFISRVVGWSLMRAQREYRYSRFVRIPLRDPPEPVRVSRASERK